MRLLINRVSMGAHDPEGAVIFEYCIEGQLKSGKSVQIQDKEPFDLRGLEKQEIECLLFAHINNNPINRDIKDDLVHPILRGVYLGEYDINEEWELGNLDELYKLSFSKYHAIQNVDGIFLISPKSAEILSVTKGDNCIFKINELELLSWKIIEGKRKIDALAYEKKFIEKFWNIIESTREKSGKDPELQKELIYKKLLEWSYDDIWLFGDIINYLMRVIKVNPILEGHFKQSISNWENFCRSIVALGRNAIKEVISNPNKFSNDLKTGVYGESLEKIESSINTLVQDLVKEKSGKSIEIVAIYYIRRDIESIEQRIHYLLKKEFNLHQD